MHLRIRALYFFLCITALTVPGRKAAAKAVIEGNRVTFIYRAPESTKIVYLAGTFNSWNSGATPMKFDPKEKSWKTSMNLQSGEYMYKFVLDGSNWQTDPEASSYSADGYNNAVLRVGLPEKIVESHTGDGEIYMDAVLHEQKSPYLDLLSDGRIAFRLRTNKNDVERCWLVTRKGRVEMHLYGSDDYFDYYRATSFLQPSEPYSFALQDGAVTVSYPKGRAFAWLTPPHPFLTPKWAKDAVFYQVYVNSFANGDPGNDPPGTAAWVSEPLYNQSGPHGFDAYYGGDLQGVIQKLGYLKGLGITALYLNPIFKARSTHKYNTADYMQIDPSYGTEQTFRDLLKQAHREGIRVVIDGVFNHSGTAFFAFQDLLEKQESSKYKNWYHVTGWPVVRDGKPLNYKAWWGFGELPQLNVLNPETKKYLMDVARKWGGMGLDGWRLDAANEVPHEFWADFRRVVKGVNPEAYIVGEIWDNGSPWLEGDQFDSVMNYRFRAACLEFFAGFDSHKDNALNEAMKQVIDTQSPYWQQKMAEFKTSISAADFDRQLGEIRIETPEEAHSTLLNLLDSHDRYRFLMLLEDNLPAYKLAIFFQMTYPGTPCVYYGSEVGMEGGRDPDDRRAMQWNESQWNREIAEHYRKMIRMRREHPALRQGDFYTLYAKGRQYGFVRENQQEKILVLLNNFPQPSTVSVPWNGAMRNFQLQPYEGTIKVETKQSEANQGIRKEAKAR